MKRIAALLCIALAGCATTTGTGPDVTTSGFDGARIVDIHGHANACDKMRCTGLGAQWSSKTPTSAFLTVHLFNDIKGITGASLSIDGQVTILATSAPFTNFNGPGTVTPESRKSFVVPLALIRQITTAKKAWLRVQTTDGYVEDAIVDGQVDSKAFHALRRFLVAVDAKPV